MKLWVVWYETRPLLACGRWDRTKITVAAASTDDAYQEAARELGQKLELRFPIRCDPCETN